VCRQALFRNYCGVFHGCCRYQKICPYFEKDYNEWYVKMDVSLGFHAVDEVVKIGFHKPSKNVGEELKVAFKENKKLDCKARCYCISVFLQQFSIKFQRLQHANRCEIC